jgi:PAS domain-containing protein
VFEFFQRVGRVPPDYPRWLDGIHAFLQDVPAWAWAKDAGLRYLFVSRMAQEAIGVPAWLWEGRTDVELFAAETAAEMQRTDREVIESGQPVGFLQQYDGTGVPRTLSVLKFPVSLADGSVGVAGIAFDVTDGAAHPIALDFSPRVRPDGGDGAA